MVFNENGHGTAVVRIVGLRNETSWEHSLRTKLPGEGPEGVLVVRFSDNLHEAGMSRRDADGGDEAAADVIDPSLRGSLAPRLAFLARLSRTVRLLPTTENRLKDCS